MYKITEAKDFYRFSEQTSKISLEYAVIERKGGRTNIEVFMKLKIDDYIDMDFSNKVSISPRFNDVHVFMHKNKVYARDMTKKERETNSIVLWGYRFDIVAKNKMEIIKFNKNADMYAVDLFDCGIDEDSIYIDNDNDYDVYDKLIPDDLKKHLCD